MPFIAGVLVGNCIGFLIAVFCHIASDLSDYKEVDIEVEKDNKE